MGKTKKARGGCCGGKDDDEDDTETNDTSFESTSASEGWVSEPTVPADVDFHGDWFVNAGGLRLRTYKFSKRNAPCKGIVVLCHGYAAHFCFEWFLPTAPGKAHERWEDSVLQGLVNAGYAVVGLDHQSMGRSESRKEGIRSYFDHFDDLALEIIGFLKKDILGDAKFQGLPLFAMGVSMGGAVTVRLTQLEPSLFRGAVLYAPMLSLEEVKKKVVAGCITNGHLSPIAGFLDAFIPTVPIAKVAKNTVHPLSQVEFDEDPLCWHGDCRTRVAKEFGNITDKFMAGLLAEMIVPFVTFHSCRDTFTDPLGSETLVKMAKATDKTYVRVGKGLDLDVDIWHALAVEPGADVVFAKALEWMRART